MFPERKKTFWQKIKSWLSYIKTYKIEIPINRTINGIKNIRKWAKIVWNDGDYNYTYTIDVLKFKLENLKQTETEEKIRYIDICIRLIEKIWSNENFDRTYDMEYCDYHETKTTWIPVENGMQMDSKIISDRFDEFFQENKLLHKKAIKYLAKDKRWSSPKSKLTQSMVISKLKSEKAKMLLSKILVYKIFTDEASY